MKKKHKKEKWNIRNYAKNEKPTLLNAKKNTSTINFHKTYTPNFQGTCPNINCKTKIPRTKIRN